MQDDILESITYIGLVYTVCMIMLVPIMIYLLRHREDTSDVRWLWSLGCIIILTLFVITFGIGMAELII